MRQYYAQAGLAKLCLLFGKSRQAYYDHEKRVENSFFEEGFILDTVKEIRQSMPRIGCLKLHFMLRIPLSAHKISIGRDRFCCLLRDNNMMVKMPKWRVAKTTNSQHPYYKWPDISVGLVLTEPHQLWVSDITYLRTASGFLYLSVITDAYSRKIVGHHLSHSPGAQGCIQALGKAISQLPAATPVIHHSDRGVQYCCRRYVALLQDSNIAISMTQNGSPYENAKAERINGILKTEFGLSDTFDNYNQAVKSVSQAITTYNRLRPHMSCAMLTPQQAHDK